MNLNLFVQLNNLKAGDAIILTKKLFGLFDHYVIYLGVFGNRHEFIANYTKGIQIVPDHEITQFLTILEPKTIERLEAEEHERFWAVQRAKSRIGEKSYGLVSHNCEHFKNWVQKGIEYSTQVENFSNISLTAGAGLAIAGLASKNKTVTALGILALIAGGISKSLETEKRAPYKGLRS